MYLEHASRTDSITAGIHTYFYIDDRYARICIKKCNKSSNYLSVFYAVFPQV